MSNEKVLSMQCTHGYTVYEKRMYVCLYWLWSTDYVQMYEILWNKYSFIYLIQSKESMNLNKLQAVSIFQGLYCHMAICAYMYVQAWQIVDIYDSAMLTNVANTTV